MDDSNGIGISGCKRSVLTSSVPLGITFKIEISTIRSVATFTPVVSRSKIAKGRFKIKVILMDFKKADGLNKF
jgi:hypothetical protein